MWPLRAQTRAEDEDVRSRRKLTWRIEDDKAFAFSGYLPPEAGAVVLQAIRAAPGDLEHPHDDDADGVSAETPVQRLHRHDQDNGIAWDGDKPPRQQVKTPVQDLADALVEVCAAYLRSKIVSADNADVYQIIVHAGTQAITEDPEPAETDEPAKVPEPEAAGEPGGVSAETSIGHPACPGRCHLDDGPAISPAALRLIGCNATISTMIHDADGNVLNVGRRSRKPPAALRRAVRERDGSRCQYPGFAFYTPHGALIPASPSLPEVSGDITGCHPAAITPATIIPPHSGERLDLHLAIWICFNNARIKAERRQDPQTQAQ
jgi:hypothetical protein